MSETIGAIKLAGDARRFVFANLATLKEHLKIIFPMVLLLELFNSLGKATGREWISLITLIPIVYLYACFALSWHRTSLMGPNVAHAINPLHWEPKKKGFLLLFFALVMIPFVIAVIIGIAVGAASMTQNGILIGIAILAAIALSIYVFVQLIRVSFMLPARSVDVALSMADARKASRGLVFKILAAGFVIGLGFLGVILLYGVIVAFTVGMMTAGTEPSHLMTGIITFLFSVPIQAAAFVVTAMNITVLSRAYQWGMQNNA